MKPFWLQSGPLLPEDWSKRNDRGIQRFVTTPTVESCVRDIVAAVAANVAPILLQVCSLIKIIHIKVLGTYFRRKDDDGGVRSR